MFGSAISAISNQTNSAIQALWNRGQAREAMNFSASMANSAYQRSVADLKAAGLNPILALGGRGAGGDSGVASSMGGVPPTDWQTGRKQEADIGVAKGQIGLLDAQTEDTRESAELKRLNQGVARNLIRQGEADLHRKEMIGDMYSELSSAYQAAKRWGYQHFLNPTRPRPSWEGDRERQDRQGFEKR